MKGRKSKKWLKLFTNIIFVIFMIIIVALIIATAKARITGQEPSIFGHKLYVVDSGSMNPTIKVGTLIIVKEVEPKEVVKGDIITYHGSKTSLVTHRVVKVEDGGNRFITKGDANETADPMPLEGNKLIGKVVYSIPLIGLILGVLNTKQGVGIALILILILLLMRSLFKDKKVAN